MTINYIAHNQYRYRTFKSPVGFVKFLLDGFIDAKTGYINIVEENLVPESTLEEIHRFAIQEVERIKNLK